MSDLPYTLQANFKFGPQYKETLVNVPAQSPEEMLEKLAWLTENAAKFVAAQAALNGVAEVPSLAGNVASVQVVNEPPAQQNNGGWGAPQGTPPPQWSQPAQQGPACQHGPMVYREGNGAKGPWKAYFCPTPKGTPGQCQAQFQK